MFKTLELFAGAGGLALGLHQSGLDVIGLIENDKNCCNTLRKNMPSWNVIEGDIEAIVETGIRSYIGNEEVDLISGGFPCQAFSYAGKSRGFEDTRGTLFHSYASILKVLKPKIFFAENVKGLLSHDHGRTFSTIMAVFTECGYNVTCKILTACDFGVGQKRERMIIIGVREDIGIPFEYPEKSGKITTIREALDGVPDSKGVIYNKKKAAVMDLVPEGGCWRHLPEDIAKEYMGKSYYATSGGRTSYARRTAWDKPCPTLMCTPAQKQTELCHPSETRPFTVREYARLQSFPDSWEFQGGVTQQYKQIGNAVPVLLAKAVGDKIVEFLENIERN